MIPHRVMACDVVETKRRWQAIDHPWYSLFFEIRHPDIDLTPFPVVTAREEREPDGTRTTARTRHHDMR
jgi:hypothetical protein